MKNVQTLLAIAVLGIGLSTMAQPSKPGYATVVRVKGAASYSLDGGTTRFPLEAGKYLEAGASIYTGADGMVDVVLGKSMDLPQADFTPKRISYAVDAPVRGMISYRPSAEQNALRVMGDSTLVIDKLTTTSSGADTVSDTELDLQKGSIYASVKKLSPAAQYLVKTPTGIAGVRGTDVFIALNPNGSIKSVSVFHTHNDEGLVLAITLPDGTTKTYLLKDGQGVSEGDVQPSQLNPQVMRLLSEIFPLVHTHFFQTVNFDFDRTYNCESSDFGHR